MQLSPGTVVRDKYRIVRLIGEGGMGQVYEAEHQALGSSVALKFLLPDLAQREGLAKRFLREARVSASIRSQHVVGVADVDTSEQGTPFLVMELLVGETLQQVLDQRQRLPLPEALPLIQQILAGLDAAHAQGVVHRDLKPDNVFLVQGGAGPLVKLIDFGIAKLRTSSEYTRGLTRAGMVMGTPEYMPPEQLFAASEVDHRADIFAFGVIIYEMLTGQLPAQAEEPMAIAHQVINRQVRRLTDVDSSLPGGLADLVHRAMDPERDARFASLQEFRQALDPLVQQLGATALPGQASVAAELSAALPIVPARVHAVPDTLPPEDGHLPAVQAAPGSLPTEPSRTGTVAGGDPFMAHSVQHPMSQQQPPQGHPPQMPYPQQPQQVQPPYAGAAPAPAAPPPASSSGRTLLIVVLVALPLLAVAAAGMGYFLLKGSDAPELPAPEASAGAEQLMPALEAPTAAAADPAAVPPAAEVPTAQPVAPAPGTAPKPGTKPTAAPTASAPAAPTAPGTAPAPSATPGGTATAPAPAPKPIEIPKELQEGINKLSGALSGLIPPPAPPAPAPTSSN